MLKYIFYVYCTIVSVLYMYANEMNEAWWGGEWLMTKR